MDHRAAPVAARMPAIFIGHGTPFNALQDNRFTAVWKAYGQRIPRPKAVLAVSAHWFIGTTAVTSQPMPRTVHDFFGFPRHMYEIDYPAPGAPQLAVGLQELLGLGLDVDQWGLDHGTWSVLCHMFPDADVPVVQLSINCFAPVAYHLELGKRLGPLRDEGILIMASGNIVHNLSLLDRSRPGQGPDWATRYDALIQRYLRDGDDQALIEYQRHADADLAVPTPDHYLPLLYAAGLRRNDESMEVLVDGLDIGCVSMTSVEFAPKLSGG